MKVLVFGNGWLGNHLATHFDGSVSECDILDSERVAAELAEVRPDMVINAAGKCGSPNIDWCAATPDNKRLTQYVNSFGPAILCHTVDGVGAHLHRDIDFVHLSSGCLWEDAQDVDEQTKVDPPSWYSETKWEGEKRLPEDECLIIRARMPINAELHPRNLISKLARYEHVLDVPNSVTFVDDLCMAIEKLVQEGETGVYNVVNPGPLSAWEIMSLYCELVDDHHICDKVDMDWLRRREFITDGRSNCTLNIDKLTAAGVQMPDAKEKIREVMEEYARAKVSSSVRQAQAEKGDQGASP